MYLLRYPYKLFSQGDLQQTLEQQMNCGQRKIALITPEKFFATSIDDTVKRLALDMRVAALVIDEKAIQIGRKKICIAAGCSPQPHHEDTVSAPYNRACAGPIKVPGIKFTIRIPYTGDPLLWQLAPFYKLNNLPVVETPCPNAQGKGVLKITRKLPLAQAEINLNTWLDLLLEEIHTYLREQRRQIEAFQENLEQHLQDWVISRFGQFAVKNRYYSLRSAY